MTYPTLELKPGRVSVRPKKTKWATNEYKIEVQLKQREQKYTNYSKYCSKENLRSSR